MKASSFRHFSLSQAKRKTLTINSFGGVDYSSQRFLVADRHAIDIKNFLYKDGVVQKRYGIEHILTVEDYTYVPSNFENPQVPLIAEVHNNFDEKNINNMWRFKAEDGEYHIIAHIGKLIYEITEIGTDYCKATPLTNGRYTVDGNDYDLCYEFENYKSFAFVGGNKLWFLGGNKYMCLRFLPYNNRLFFTLENSSFTPIPTTTISITYTGALSSDQQSYDNVNLLTMWRKNMLISGIGKSETSLTKTTFYEYTLDAPLVYKQPKDMADVEINIEEIGELED